MVEGQLMSHDLRLQNGKLTRCHCDGPLSEVLCQATNNMAFHEQLLVGQGSLKLDVLPGDIPTITEEEQPAALFFLLCPQMPRSHRSACFCPSYHQVSSLNYL